MMLKHGISTIHEMTNGILQSFDKESLLLVVKFRLSKCANSVMFIYFSWKLQASKIYKTMNTAVMHMKEHLGMQRHMIAKYIPETQVDRFQGSDLHHPQHL